MCSKQCRRKSGRPWSSRHQNVKINLIHTAVTQAKKLVVMVGSQKAMAMGVKNDRIMRRYTYLGERLMQL
ncbi:MAG: hypothetical protein P8175_13555 [Deltaproteobacteria bacterium]